MFQSTYTNSYKGALQDLINLENLLHRTQTKMNGGKPDITFKYRYLFRLCQH